MIEKGDILIINLPGEVILNKTKDDDISLVGEIKGSISEVRFKVLKNSLLYSFTRTWKKIILGFRIEKGKCKKLNFFNNHLFSYSGKFSSILWEIKSSLY